MIPPKGSSQRDAASCSSDASFLRGLRKILLREGNHPNEFSSMQPLQDLSEWLREDVCTLSLSRLIPQLDLLICEAFM